MFVSAGRNPETIDEVPSSVFCRFTYCPGWYKDFLLTAQLSYVDETFSDANNTVAVSSNAQTGLMPSYTVADLTAVYKFSKGLNIKAGINNLLDERYFTRRSGGYPGPGALPADGRSFFISVGEFFEWLPVAGQLQIKISYALGLT